MRLDRRALAAALLPAALLALTAAGVGALLWATLEPAGRAELAALLEPRIALVVMLLLVLALAGGALLRRAWLQFAAAPAALAEQLQVATAAATFGATLPADRGSAGSRALAGAVNGLLAQRDALRREIDERVAAASRAVEQERSRLAALMAELTQSVVVCNLDGRVLLFNARARQQLRALDASGAGEIGGSEALALGRSVYALLDRRLVSHALEAVQQGLARGAAQPSAQFVTAAPGGQLLRVQLAAVREPGAAPGQALNGFVLVLDDITRELADAGARDRLLHTLTEGSRGALGTLQAAVELLDDPALDAATRQRFHEVIRDEVRGLAARVQAAADAGTQALKTRWPLEDMLGADLVAAVRRRIEQQHGCRTEAVDVDPALWLRVDSFSLVQALAFLAGRLVADHGVPLLQLRLQPDGGRARLDLMWIGPGLSTETVVGWETETMSGAGGETLALTLRDVVERHGGAFWFERERVRQEAFFRFLLPLASEAAPLEVAALSSQDSRPEFYDFDLFASRALAGDGSAEALLAMPLAELAYTVFDTETTGLEPSAGDEILQIGATRIAAGKLRREQCFEQLVDPQRPIPDAGRAIHGIEPAMVQGQPTITTVLPVFHAFASDTVLVAHNAAFDMRFLQIKEVASGVRFTQPVLDTLLLSAVLHPNQESHRLEAIAERLGVPVLGRHTALGDALVTAEVFVKMVPLLEAQGICTLGQALEASRQHWLARVTY